MKNELRNIQANEANLKSGYTTDLVNPDKKPIFPSNSRDKARGVSVGRTEGVFGSTGRIGFDSTDFNVARPPNTLSATQDLGNFRKGQSSRVLPANYGLNSSSNPKPGLSRGFLGMKMNH